MVFMENVSQDSPNSQRPSSVPVNHSHGINLDDPNAIKTECLVPSRPTSTHSLQANFYRPSSSQNSPYQQQIFQSTVIASPPVFKQSYSPPLVDESSQSQQFLSFVDTPHDEKPKSNEGDDFQSFEEDDKTSVVDPMNTSEDMLSETSGDSDQLIKTEEKVDELESVDEEENTKKDWMETMRLYAERLRPVDCLVFMEECRPFNAHTDFMNYFKEHLLKPILQHLNGGPEINVEFGCDVYTSLYSFLTLNSSTGRTIQRGASTTPMIYRILKEFDDLSHQPRFSPDLRLPGSSFLQQALDKYSELDNYRSDAHCQSVRYLLLLAVSDVDMSEVETLTAKLRDKSVRLSVFSPRQSDSFRQLYEAVNGAPCALDSSGLSATLWPTALLSSGMCINGLSSKVGGHSQGQHHGAEVNRPGVAMTTATDAGQNSMIQCHPPLTSVVCATSSQPPSISSVSQLDQPPSSNLSDNVCTPQSFVVASPLPQPNTPHSSEAQQAGPPPPPPMSQPQHTMQQQVEPSIRQPMSMIRPAPMLQPSNQMAGMIPQQMRPYQQQGMPAMSRSPHNMQPNMNQQQVVQGGQPQPNVLHPGDYSNQAGGHLTSIIRPQQQQQQPVAVGGRIMVSGAPGQMIRQRLPQQPPHQYSSSPVPQGQVMTNNMGDQMTTISIFDGLIRYCKDKDPCRGRLSVEPTGDNMRIPNLQHWNNQAIITVLRVERNSPIVETHLVNQNQLLRTKIDFHDPRDSQNVQAQILSKQQGGPNILALGILSGSSASSSMVNAIRCVCLVVNPKNGQIIGLIPGDQEKFFQDVQFVMAQQQQRQKQMQQQQQQQANFNVGPQNPHVMMNSAGNPAFYQQQQHMHQPMTMSQQQPMYANSMPRSYLHNEGNRPHPGSIYPNSMQHQRANMIRAVNRQDSMGYGQPATGYSASQQQASAMDISEYSASFDPTTGMPYG